MNQELITKALSVATGGNLTGYLPDPVVREVIGYIRDVNVMRTLLRPAFRMHSRTKTKPAKLGGTSAYHIPDGTTAVMSQYSTGTVTWTAKKLMVYTPIDEEANEDVPQDMEQEILKDFGEAFGEAEESALVGGEPDHLANAPTPTLATTVNWFKFDPRLICEGLFGVAISTDASTSVDAGDALFNLNNVNKAIYNLGKFGRSRRRLVGLLPSVQAMFVRQDSHFKDASVSGQALASFITGNPSGSPAEARGIVGVIYGIPFYEVPSAPDDVVAIFDKSSPEIGDRRRIKLRSKEVIEADQVKYVGSERVAFNYNRRDALVAIENLAITEDSSSS